MRDIKDRLKDTEFSNFPDELCAEAVGYIEQLESLESAVRAMLDAGEWRRVSPSLHSIGYETVSDVKKDAALIQAVRDRLGEELSP